MITALLPFAVIGLCALPWLLLAARRMGAMLAGLAVLCGAPLLVFGVMLVTAPLRFNPLGGVLSTAALLGVVGLALVLRDRAALRRPSALTLARWLPAAIGAVLWMAVLAIAHRTPGADALSWAMNGDSANNIHIARAMLEDNGIALPLTYPVPLPDALLTLAMGLGRPDAGGAALLQHDLTALGVTWALAIGATGLLLGLTASSLLRRGALVTALTSGVGSLLSATWFVSGLPIDSGYLNVHVALPFALAAWLAFLQFERHPIAATVVLLAVALVLLTVWTPLIVIAAGFLARALWSERGRLSTLSRRSAWTLGVAAAVVAGALIVALPGYLRVGSAASAPGHGYPSTFALLTASGAVAIACTAVLRRKARSRALQGAAALAAACALGILVIVILAGASDASFETYYAAKLSWLLTVVLGAVALSAVVGLLGDRPRGVVAVAPALAVTLVLCTIGPSPARDIDLAQPLDRMLAGKVWNDGDASVEVVLEHTGHPEAVVLWDSSHADEAMINFWLFEFGGGAQGGDSYVRSVSIAGYREFRDTGAYAAPAVDVLCQVIEHLKRPVTVVTTRPTLQAELEAECPTAPVFVTQE